MRATAGAFILGFSFNRLQTLAQDIVTQSINIDTGICAVASGTADPGRIGGSSGGSVGGSSVYACTSTEPNGVVLIGTSIFHYPVTIPSNLANIYTTSNSLGSMIVQTETAISSPTSSTAQPAGTPSSSNNPLVNSVQIGGQNYVIRTGTDYPGNDLKTPYVNTLLECLQACSGYIPDPTVQGGKPCIAASFGAGNVGGNCYLKYAITEVNVGNGGFSVGRNINYNIPRSATTDSLVQYPSPTSKSSTAPGPATTSSPAVTQNPCIGPIQPTGTEVTTSNSQVYNVSCQALFDSDLLYLGDASSFPECLSFCDYFEGCNGVAYQKNLTSKNCQLLSTISLIVYGHNDFDSGYSTGYRLSPDVKYFTLSGGVSIIAPSIPVSLPIIGVPTSGSSTGLNSLVPVGATASSAPSGSSRAIATGTPLASPTRSLAVAVSSLPVLPPSNPRASSGLASTKPVQISSSSLGAASASLRADASPSSGASNTPPALGTSSSPRASGTAAGSNPFISSEAAGASSLPDTTTLLSVISPSPTFTASSSSIDLGDSLSNANPGISTNAPGTSEGTPASTGGSPEPTIQNPEPDCNANPPVGNYTRYVDLFAYTYDIRCALQVDGDNADVNAHADTFPECLEYCSLLDECVAVTYQDGNNANNDNSNCYPYYSFRGYNTGAPAGLYSGVNVDGPSTGALGSTDVCGADGTGLNAGVFGPDTFGNCYQVGCGDYMTWTRELFATDMTTLKGCLTYCSFYDDCVAVDWIGPHVPGMRDQSNCIPIAETSTVSSSVGQPTGYAAQIACP